MNPVKAKITSSVDYKWSSYEAYKNGENSFVNVNFVLSIMSTNKTKAMKVYMQYMDEDIEEIEQSVYEIVDAPVVEIDMKQDKVELEEVIEEVMTKEGLTEEELLSKAKTRLISKVRKEIVLRAEKECDKTTA